MITQKIILTWTPVSDSHEAILNNTRLFNLLLDWKASISFNNSNKVS